MRAGIPHQTQPLRRGAAHPDVVAMEGGRQRLQGAGVAEFAQGPRGLRRVELLQGDQQRVHRPPIAHLAQHPRHLLAHDAIVVAQSVGQRLHRPQVPDPTPGTPRPNDARTSRCCATAAPGARPAGGL